MGGPAPVLAFGAPSGPAGLSHNGQAKRLPSPSKEPGFLLAQK